MFNSSASTSIRAAQRAPCGSGNGSRSRSRACQQWQQPACFAASCSHAVLVVSGMCARVASSRDGGAVWAHIALVIASAVRAGDRDAPIIASAMHVCVNARLSVRVPVHGVGESDRLNRMYSDMKYIFCEYLRPFAARGEHAVARARVHEDQDDLW